MLVGGVAGTGAVGLASRTRFPFPGEAADATATIIHRRMIAGPGTSPSATTPSRFGWIHSTGGESPLRIEANIQESASVVNLNLNPS